MKQFVKRNSYFVNWSTNFFKTPYTRNMKPKNRRQFIAAAALLGAGVAASALPLAGKTNPAMQQKAPVIHHVFFWLKNPASEEDLAKLLAGLRTLKGIETVRQIYIGVPASTEKRDVVDNSYHASELLFFDDLAGQSVYQDHPIHQQFIKDCAHLWAKVVVYDAVNV